MTIGSMWLQVKCDGCGNEIEVELETQPGEYGRWPKSIDKLYDYLAHINWTWTDGGFAKDLCPKCSDGPTAEDIADYKAYHRGEGVHTP